MMRLVSVCCAAIRLHQWPWRTSTGSVFRGFVCFLTVRAILKWLGATHWLVSSVDRWGPEGVSFMKIKAAIFKTRQLGKQQPQKRKTTRVVLSRYLCERAKSDAVQQVMGGGSSYRCGVTGKLSITVASVWVIQMGKFTWSSLHSTCLSCSFMKGWVEFRRKHLNNKGGRLLLNLSQQWNTELSMCSRFWASCLCLQAAAGADDAHGESSLHQCSVLTCNTWGHVTPSVSWSHVTSLSLSGADVRW